MVVKRLSYQSKDRPTIYPANFKHKTEFVPLTSVLVSVHLSCGYVVARDVTSITILPCKAKKQCLFTLQVSRYCLFCFAAVYRPLSKELLRIIKTNHCMDG